jgi:phenylpropionate dioxygenase-like ring-hydroxylating dioxygenase large terminal subunit
MGADLSLGEVFGDDVRCMFHYSASVPTACAPASVGRQRAARGAQCTASPYAERWGLIWFFNGPEPLCDPPGMRDYADDDIVVRRGRTDLFPWSRG